MTAIDLKAEIMHLLKEVKDTNVLEQVRAFVHERLHAPEVGDDFTEEELAELEKRRARRISGESKPHSVEESMRLARQGFKR